MKGVSFESDELVSKLVDQLSEAKQWAAVVEYGELARHLSPYLSGLRARIGEALLRLNKRKEAEAELQAALRALPEAGSDDEEPERQELAQRRAAYQALLDEARGGKPGPAPAPAGGKKR